MTTNDIAQEVELMIGRDLAEKYSHLSYLEMAAESELEEFREELLQADHDWYIVE